MTSIRIVHVYRYTQLNAVVLRTFATSVSLMLLSLFIHFNVLLRILTWCLECPRRTFSFVSNCTSFTVLFLSCQPPKPRSRSWNDRQDNKTLQQASIWSKRYVPGLTNAPSASPVREKLSPTKGKERVVSVKGLKLPHKEPQVKRPREGKVWQHKFEPTIQCLLG